MRYLLASAILILSQIAVADVDQACKADCTSKGYSCKYCEEACSYDGQAEDTPGGYIGGYIQGQRRRAQMEKEAAEKRQLEARTRALELENQQREAELRQAAAAEATTSNDPKPPGVSAEQGNPLAQLRLAMMYDKGEGAPQDYVLAYMWYNLAAANASPTITNEERESAAKNRNLVAAKMTREQIAEAQKLAREWKPKAE